MEMPLTVTLSSKISERIKKAVALQHQDVTEVIEAVLEEALAWRDNDFVDSAPHALDKVPTPEMQAYIALHPVLKEKYLGKSVAVYNGKLIDVDDDFDTLYDRIDARYPDAFVWMSKVEEEPIPTFAVRSPRIVRNEPT